MRCGSHDRCLWSKRKGSSSLLKFYKRQTRAGVQAALPPSWRGELHDTPRFTKRSMVKSVWQEASAAPQFIIMYTTLLSGTTPPQNFLSPFLSRVVCGHRTLLCQLRLTAAFQTMHGPAVARAGGPLLARSARKPWQGGTCLRRLWAWAGLVLTMSALVEGTHWRCVQRLLHVSSAEHRQCVFGPRFRGRLEAPQRNLDHSSRLRPAPPACLTCLLQQVARAQCRRRPSTLPRFCALRPALRG